MLFKRGLRLDIDNFKAFQTAGARRIEERSVGSDPVKDNTDDNHQLRVVDAGLIDKMIGVTQKDAVGQTSTDESVLSTNASWEGKLRTEGSIRIGGKMSGSIEAGETVFVAVGACVRADVRARRVIVGGDLEGHITCQEQLVVEHSGRLGGKVNTTTLIVEEGAVVRSQIEMLCAGAA